MDSAYGMLGYNSIHLRNGTIPIRECNARKKFEWPEARRGSPVDRSMNGRQRIPSNVSNLDQGNDGCDLIKPTVLRPQRSNTLPSTPKSDMVRSMDSPQSFRRMQQGHSLMQPTTPVRAQRRASSHAALDGALQSPIHAMGGRERTNLPIPCLSRTMDNDSSQESPGRLTSRPTPCHWSSMLDSRSSDGSGYHYSSPVRMEKRQDPLWISPQARATRRASIGCFVPLGYPPDCEIEVDDPVLMCPGVRAVARRGSMGCSAPTRDGLNAVFHEIDQQESVRVSPRRAARRASIACSTPTFIPCQGFDSNYINRQDTLPTNPRARASRRASIGPTVTTVAGPPEIHQVCLSTIKPARRPMRRLSMGPMTGTLFDSDASLARQQNEVRLSDQSHESNSPRTTSSVELPTLKGLLFRHGTHRGATHGDLPLQPRSQSCCAHPDGDVDVRRPATEKRSMQRRKSLACTAAERPRVWV
jgi:hypothetical protein